MKKLLVLGLAVATLSSASIADECVAPTAESSRTNTTVSNDEGSVVREIARRKRHRRKRRHRRHHRRHR